MKENGIKLVCLDLNDTLVKEKTWPNLNFAMGMTPEENKMFYTLHTNREITYTMWVEIALGIYKQRNNLKRKDFEKIVNNFSYYPFAKELVSYLKQKYIVVIISCAMSLLVENVAQDLGINHSKSLTEFFFDEHDHISEVKVDDRTGNEADNKVLFLHDICVQQNIRLEQCVCIGDGSNDYKLFEITKGITFEKSKKEHKNIAWEIVHDLGAIKNIL